MLLPQKDSLLSTLGVAVSYYMLSNVCSNISIMAIEVSRITMQTPDSEKCRKQDEHGILPRGIKTPKLHAMSRRSREQLSRQENCKYGK